MLRVIERWKRTRGHAWKMAIMPALLATLLAALLAGCSGGGSTRPGGYKCTAPQNPYGCYTSIEFSHAHLNPDTKPDIAGDPVVLWSDLYVVPLTCDAACRASSGNGNPPGTIANFMQLYQQSDGSYIRMGYETTPAGLQYFLEYRIPGVNGGQYTHWDMTPVVTGAGPNTDTPYRFAPVFIGRQGEETIFGHPGDWLALMAPPYVQYPFIGQVLGQSSFHPDRAYYGQSIYGTGGATALLSAFANNNIFTSPYSSQHLQEILAEDASPPGVVNTVDHPTDAGWLTKPTMTSYGGMFYVSCC